MASRGQRNAQLAKANEGRDSAAVGPANGRAPLHPNRFPTSVGVIMLVSDPDFGDIA